MTNKRSLIGQAIGRQLQRGEGLRVAYLPQGVDPRVAEDIVRASNEECRLLGRTDPFGQPLAVIVSEEAENFLDPDCIYLRSSSILRYRRGNRLVVVLGQPPELASFVDSFKEILGQDFPAARGAGLLDTDSLAETVASIVLAEAGISVFSEASYAGVTKSIAQCLDLAQHVQRAFGQTSKPWNTNWLGAADRGLENLVGCLRGIQTTDLGDDLSEFVDRKIYACFGLPHAASQVPSGTIGKKISEAFELYWGSEESVSLSAAQLKYHPDTLTENHPMREVSWEGFNERLAASENTIEAMQSHSSQAADLVDALSMLNLRQFLNPSQTSEAMSELVVENLARVDLRFDPEVIGSPFFVTTVVTTLETGKRALISEPVRVRIPLKAAPQGESLKFSRLDLAMEGKAYSWSGAIIGADDSHLIIEGSFRFLLPSGEDPRYQMAPRRLSVSAAGNDSLAEYADLSASANVCLIPPQAPVVVCLPIKQSRAKTKPAALGPDSLSPSEGSPSASGSYDLEMDPSFSTYGVVALTAGKPPTMNASPMALWPTRPSLFRSEIQPSGANYVSVDGEIFTLYVPETTAIYESPILAAIECQSVSAQEVPQSSEDTLQAAYETAIGQLILDDGWSSSLGHVAVPVNADFDLDRWSEYPPARVRVAGPLSTYFAKHPKFKISQALAQSTEVEKFVQSFYDLGVSASIKVDGPLGPRPVWPSRTSWRHLYEEDNQGALQTYLAAYSQLVAKARELGGIYDLFWATYPFSTSIWDESKPFDCAAVLLSPLHPIRLAWVASVESSLWDISLTKDLVGTIEGWNFPALGPGTSKFGKMIAVPMDSGPGQVFLGWSMMVSAPLGAPQPLDAPTRVGALRTSGGATSGLTSAAATSAVRNYMRLNPQVSTLTVDLAASAATSRLDDIDNSILDEAKRWVFDGSSPLLGGIRVWDSLSRDGNPPADRLLREARVNGRTPISWKRYKHDHLKPIPCDIRFVNDSSSLVNYDEMPGAERGAIGQVPLRRFEIHSKPSQYEFVSESRPGLQEGNGWSVFSNAMRIVENTACGPVIKSELAPQISDSESANWTISGETFLSPTSMVDLLKQTSAGRQMLWEWRPPFLDVKSEGRAKLERRPFISVTRVPKNFRSQVGSLIGKALGVDAEEDKVSHVLGVLGSRGIGLSTLLAIGGTHASGALGFYLTLALSEAAISSSMDTFILPLDACEGFLNALAGDSNGEKQGKRADLLLVKITSTSLYLAPIEIKSYRLESDGCPSNLPDVGSSDLDEAAGQLRDSIELLQRVAEAWDRVRDQGVPADRLLWANGMASLVEAAIRLQPPAGEQEERLVKHLSYLLSGAMDVKVGRGLVSYFAHGGIVPGSLESFIASGPTTNGTDEFRVLSANTGKAFSEVNVTTSDIVGSWKDMVEWATATGEEDKTHRPFVGGGPDVDGTSSGAKSELEVASEGRSARDLTTEGADPQVPADHLLVADSRGEANDGVRISVGRLTDSVGQGEAYFWPGNTDLHQMNIGVVGDLGTGKTQLLKALILKLRRAAGKTQENPLSFLIFDYKGDFQDPEFLASVGGHVLEPEGIPLNVLSRPGADTLREAHKRAMEFYDIMQKIYKNLGPVQRQRLSSVVRESFGAVPGKAPTLGQILEAYEKEAGAPDSITSILSDFVYSGVFSEKAEELQTFDELIKDRVLVVNLKSLGTNQQMKNALVVLFLNMYYDYMLRSEKWRYRPGATIEQVRLLNSFLLVDEAVNIMDYDFPVLDQLLLQGREFGFGVILASQYLSHFRTSGTDYAEPLRTWFIHKVPQVNQRQLVALGLPAVKADAAARISSLPNHHAFYITLGHSGVFIKGHPYYQL